MRIKVCTKARNKTRTKVYISIISCKKNYLKNKKKRKANERFKQSSRNVIWIFLDGLSIARLVPFY